MTGSRRTVTSSEAPQALGPYSHGVVAAGLLFCSGQVSLDPATGRLVGATPAEQSRRCLENLDAVCRAAGASLARAVRTTIYLLDMEAFAQVNEVYASFFGEDPPARATVQVSGLPAGALVEIDAVVDLSGTPAVPAP